MGSSLLRRLVVVSVILVVPAVGYAQEAAVTGTVTDTTMAVMPGVTIKAVHVASGNTFEAVTDQRGTYRLAVRVGVFKITAELAGFSPVTREGVELLVGQTDHHQYSDDDWWRGRITHGDGAGAAHRNQHVQPRQQHRSAPGDRVAVARPQLDVAGVAGAREPDERAGRDARAGPGRRQGIPAERRRPAGDLEPRHRQPVPVQQRCHRGIPVRLEQVRRDAGTLVWRAGERHHEIGHQHAVWVARGQLPRQRLERGRPRRSARSSRIRTSRSAAPPAGRS